MIKNFNYKFLTILISVFVLVFAFTQTNILSNFVRNNSTAQAVGDLVIDWGVPSGQPIFTVNNLMPGNLESRIVKIENHASSPRPIGIRGVKTSDSDSLSEVLNITIIENGAILYGPKKLSEFFSESQEIDGLYLAMLSANSSTEYQFKIDFDSGAGNDYQEKSIIFDLQIGLSIRIPPECRQMQFDRIIYGTEGNDNLRGTNYRDLIFGLEGHDQIDGANEKDCLVGGQGNDRLDGSNAEDVLYGQEGDDYLNGSNGIDLLIGGQGNDTLKASNGDDKLYGNEGDDNLEGSNGDDLLEGNEGDDKLDGGNGNDTLIGATGTDSANGGLGIDNCEAETKTKCEL